MKRILCLLLALTMIFALCSCKTIHFGGTVVNTGDTTETASSKKKTASKADKTDSGTEDEEEEETEASETGGKTEEKGENTGSGDSEEKKQSNEWTLDNTYYKLTHDKKLTVGYIGGSVTVGTGGDTQSGCWRAYTTQWLKEKYGAQVTEINASIGGSSSVWGAPRYKSAILDKKPDLVFIEFSINDYYVATNAGNGGYPHEAESAAMIDYMIRQTQKQLPNCDIVVLTVVDSSTINKVTNNNAIAHKKAAEYEGVTYLDVTEAMLSKVSSSLSGWTNYYTDAVHPNVKGYKVYADYIQEELEQCFQESAERKASGLVAHTVKAAPYNNCVPTNYTIYNATDIKFDSNQWTLKQNLSKQKYGTSCLSAKKKGATLTFEFTGTTISMLGVFGQLADMEVVLDGKDKKNIATKSAAGEALLWTNLENTKHTVTVKVNSDNQCDLFCFAVGSK